MSSISDPQRLVELVAHRMAHEAATAAAAAPAGDCRVGRPHPRPAYARVGGGRAGNH